MTPEVLRDLRREEQLQCGKNPGLKDVFFRDYRTARLRILST